MVHRPSLTLVSLALLFGFLLASGTGCGSGISPDNSRAEMEDLVRRWDETMASGLQDEAVALYVEDDPAVMPPGKAPHLGQVGVGIYFRNLFEDGGIDVTDRLEEVVASGNLSIARGTYELTATEESGEPYRESGRWIAAAVRGEDGTLRIKRNIWNRELPPPGSAEAPPVEPQGPVPPAEDAPCSESPAAVDRAFADAWRASETGFIVANLTDDALRMPPRRPTLRGRDAIGAYLQARGEHFKFGSIQLRDTGELVDGDIGCSWGSYQISYKFQGAVARVDGQGKFIAVSRRGQDGCWRHEWVLTNNDEPWPRAEP